MSFNIAIVLSGCGFKDGAEIHESVLTLLATLKSGATPLFFAPDINQTTVTNHLNNDSQGQARNVLVESARIARGDIKNIKELNSKIADALIFPGGYGAALNLCDFAKKGSECSVDKEVERVILEFNKANKPIGFICIAPALAAKVLGHKKIKLTIGNDKSTAQALEKCGAIHENKNVEEICVDLNHKIVSTPAYMQAKNIVEAESGITKLVQKIVELI